MKKDEVNLINPYDPEQKEIVCEKCKSCTYFENQNNFCPGGESECDEYEGISLKADLTT